MRGPRGSTLVPYTTLFRSVQCALEEVLVHLVVDRFVEDDVRGCRFDWRGHAHDALLPGVLQAGTVADRFVYHGARDRKSTRLNSSHLGISYAVFCLKKKKD